jgi:F-type H+-transporting ATPase subunit b
VEHEAIHVATIGDLFWPALNFTLFVGLLAKFLGGPLREYFRARTERIRAALASGARARQEAEALRAELARDLADLPALRERLRAELRTTAQHERDQLLALARHTAERLRDDARLVAQHESQAARAALRSEVIDEAVREATAFLRAALRPEDQERFVREFTQQAPGART